MKKTKKRIVYEFVEYILSQMPGFAAEKLRASYYDMAKSFIRHKRKRRKPAAHETPST